MTDVQVPKLKPCLFCAGKGEEVSKERSDGRLMTHIKCTSCGMRTRNFFIRNRAFRAWNMRPKSYQEQFAEERSAWKKEADKWKRIAEDVSAEKFAMTQTGQIIRKFGDRIMNLLRKVAHQTYRDNIGDKWYTQEAQEAQNILKDIEETKKQVATPVHEK